MNHKLCSRCQLRARNERRPEAYDRVSTESVNIGVCSVCLGVLQEPTLNAITSKLREKLRPVTHDNRLRINTTFPPALSVVRDRAFALALASGGYKSFSVASAISSTVGVAAASSRITTPLITLRESFKWTLSSRIARLFSIRYAQEAELFLDVIFTHDSIADETAAFAEKPPPQKKSRYASSRNSDSTTRVTRIVETMPDVQFSNTVPHLIPPPSTTSPVSVDASVSVATAFLTGSYNKWSRVVSQTPWLLDDDDDDNGRDGKNDIDDTDDKPHCEGGNSIGHKYIATSVEDVVLGGIRSVLEAEKFTFVGGGREDVDVRMLGAGRPFLVEAVNPRIVPSLLTARHAALMTAASGQISTGVSMNGLRVVDRAHCAKMKQVESDKRKVYRCVVWTSCAQTLDVLHRTFDDAFNGFNLKQRTPLRVLHRRTQLVRDKAIFRTSVVRMLTEQFFVLDVEAQAGTYIKEFVHGDNGRTTPSVSSLLGCDADILQLDVLKVNM